MIDPRVQMITHDSPLGRWTLWLWLPPPELAPYVVGMWDVDGVAGHRAEKVLPCTEVVVIFNLGAPQRLLDPSDLSAGEIFDSAWAAGLQQNYLVTQDDNGSRLIGVRFTPLGAACFLGLEMAEITNRVIALEDLGAGGLSPLLDRLRHTRCARRRFALLAATIRERVSDQAGASPAVLWAWRTMIDNRGDVRTGDLAEEIGWSAKHFSRQFHRAVGLTPKAAARIMRFAYAAELLGRPGRASFSEVAQVCGYYDQSHFNRDFRAFAGDTPQGYRSRLVPDGGGAFTIVD